MLTFTQFMREQNRNAYGWLNPKGSFIKNRKNQIHGDTYTRMTGVKGEYFKKIDHALNKGWTRLDIEPDHKFKEISGFMQNKKSAWTPRHKKALSRIKKALGGKDYKNVYDKLDPDVQI